MHQRPPVAYFITFATYGSRLPGDERGTASIGQNAYGDPGIGDQPGLAGYARKIQAFPAVRLDQQMRIVVETAIRERGAYRSWTLHALNVRTNHVHVVVTAEDESPELVMRSFKARATLLMRGQGIAGAGNAVWARRGSTRKAWTESDLLEIVDYVLYQQGPSLT